MTGIFVGGLLSLVGILMAITGFRKFSNRNRYDTIVQGIIVDIEEKINRSDDTDEYEHKVYINYEYGGILYEHVQYPNYRSNMRVGDPVEIKLRSDDPREFGTGNIGAKGIGEGILGIILLAVGAISIFQYFMNL